jgi:transposase-like protein
LDIKWIHPIENRVKLFNPLENLDIFEIINKKKFEVYVRLLKLRNNFIFVKYKMSIKSLRSHKIFGLAIFSYL